jgi:ParB family chromosome partitioning protein
MLARVVENIQRSALTEADEAEAYHQLSLIGVSAAQIAKKTGRTKITVEDALKAKSTTAGDAALGKGYTIEEALILAEFFLMWTLRASQSSGLRGVALER